MTGTFFGAITAQSSVFSLADLKIGGGGYVHAMDIHSDGTLANAIDVFGGYVGSTTVGTAWRQVATNTSMPAAYINNHPYAAGGIYEIRIAPSNSSIMYMLYTLSGRSLSTVLKSTDKGLTWTATTYPNNNSDANPGVTTGLVGQSMAVDPVNANVVYAGSQASGLYVTADGGTTWALVTGVPGNTISSIVFDSTSGTTGGKTNRLIVGSQGNSTNALYVCANAGSGSPTWTKIIGGPTSFGHGKLGIDGTFYCTTFDQSQIWRLTTANVLTNITPDAQGYSTIACDPSNADKIVAVYPGGQLNVSVNCRAATPSWTGTNFNYTIAATDVPWLQASNDAYFSYGEVWFDPSVVNRIWTAMGTAVLYTDNVYTVTTGGTQQVWHSQTDGMETLVANQVIAPLNGKPILCNWDRPLWRITDPTTNQANYLPAYDTAIRKGCAVDYVAGNPPFIVALTSESNNGDDTYGFSTNGGTTWSKFPTISPGTGGCIAATDANRIVVARSNNGRVYQTQNQGTTWTNPPSLPNNAGYGNSTNNNARPLCADRVTTGTFYVYNYNTPGVYKSTDGGITWSLVFSGNISGNDSFEMQMEAVPGNAGHLYFTAGNSSDQGDYTSLTTLAASFPSNIGFFKSTNAGTAWSAVSGVNDVIAFGFGLAKPAGGGYPALYVVGWVGGTYGIFRSDDAQNSVPTWTNLGTWPRGWTDQPKCISGDMNTYGTCYIGFQGSGFAYGKFS